MAGPETVAASGPFLLHLLYLIFQHTLNLVAHGLCTGLTEMNPHDIGGAAYLLHQCGRIFVPPFPCERIFSGRDPV